MKQLILDSTALAQWQSLVQEAQSACDRSLDESLESYLVFLLMRFTDKPLCISRIMAEEYLAAQSLSGEQRVERLRDVGDHCLLFSGLFPQLAERRLVRNSYFVNLGAVLLSSTIESYRSRLVGNLRAPVGHIRGAHGYSAEHARTGWRNGDDAAAIPGIVAGHRQPPLL